MEKTINISTVSWADDVWQVYASVSAGEAENKNTYAGSYAVAGPDTMTVDELAADILARF